MVRLVPADLVAPAVGFASDNAAGVLPEVMEALAAANHGHVPAYGYDPYTARCVEQFRALFDAPVEALAVWGGTGANVVALSSLLSASDAVVGVGGSHINIDEGGAPERFLGAKIIDIPSPNGKLTAEMVGAHLWMTGDEHHVQPRVISITQSTELGTLYSADEIAALGEFAHSHDIWLHVDGARIANAAAALGGDLAGFTTRAGVDVVSFGGTKNGMMYGEAVVFVNPALATRAKYLRKQAMQLPSKARFIAAQFSAMLTDDLWLRTGAHANAMAARLYAATVDIAGVRFDHQPAVNALFPFLPAGAHATLSQWCPFYVWDVHTDQVRWMTAWDTRPEDVDRFAAGVRASLS
jgi:threonine aldolase